MLADYNVVRDLNEIVDLHATSDDRFTEGRPIHCGIGADFNVILDDDDPRLWNLDPLLARTRITEAVAADYNTGVERDPITQTASLAHDNVRMKHAVRADLHLFANKNTGKNHRPLADPRVRTDKSVRENSDAFAKNCAALDMGALTYRPVKFRYWTEKLQNFCECYIRIGTFKKIYRWTIFLVSDYAWGNDDCARPAVRQELLIARMAKKRDFPDTCFVDGSDFMNNDAAVAYDPPSDMISELTKRLAGRHLFFRPIVVDFDHLAGDIDGLIAIQDLRAFKDQREFFTFPNLGNDLFQFLENLRHHFVVFPL